MKLKLPTASRKRLEKLLTYLGNTENYSEYYKGNRAEDFKKCFDIESPWCWKYADIVLRGLEKRELVYSEGHHAVPKAFYGVKKHNPMVNTGNWFSLSYAEHLWVHYCMVWCATGKMRGKMARAFITMYSIGICKKRPLMPSEAELLDAIPEMEIKRIRAMEPGWAKVEAEGRTHSSEDPKQYAKDLYELNREKYAERAKSYREANREKCAEKERAYREANRKKLAEKAKSYREANREKCAENNKAYYEANREKISEWGKAYREANKEKIAEKNKAYREANREKILEQKRAYYEANREKIAEKKKAYREANREKIAEKNKAYSEANREKLSEYWKSYRETNREKLAEQQKAYADAKKAAGYRYRKDPGTGKHHWVFVGLPATPETPKSTSGAA